MKNKFLMTCALFLLVNIALRAQSAGPLTLSYGNDFSRIVITPDGYRLGSDATLVPYTGAYVLTGSAGGDALEIYNGSGVEQTFDITFDNLQIQAGEWEGAVAIKSETSADTIVLNLYSKGTSGVKAGNHSALASRGDVSAPRIINVSVLDGTLELANNSDAEGGFAWSSDYHNTTFNLVSTATENNEMNFINTPQGSVTLIPMHRLSLSYGNGVSRIEITPEGYRLGSGAELVSYTGPYLLTGSAGSDALEIYNGSGVEQTFDITFDNLTIQSNQWEGAVAIKSKTATDTIVLNLYSSGTSLVRSGNHTALASRENTDALRTINLTVLDGTLTLETQNAAAGGFAWSSDYNTIFNLINTVTIDGATSFTNSEQGSVTLRSDYQYLSNNDGTHQVISNGNTVVESCTLNCEPIEGTEQHRQFCVHCGYQTEPESCIPSDEWIAKDEQYHGKSCFCCEQLVSLELHADNDGDFKCDACDFFMPSGPAQVDGVYQINSVSELYWFAALVNGDLETEHQNASAAAILTADIIINENMLDSDGLLVEDKDALMKWTPIGSESTPFNGAFDGQGHTISGLYVDRLIIDGQGLFGYIGDDGVVSRTKVTDSYILGQHAVGGIAGYNRGILTACSYSGIVIGNNYSLGGVVGDNGGMLSCCYAMGKVHGFGSDSYVGGVVGGNFGAISFCYSTASLSSSNYIGGVVSYNEGHVRDSYYLQGTADEGVNINYEAVENVKSCTAEQFASGEVTWMLNGLSDENPIWFQTLGTDTLPVLENTHGIIYATGNCPKDIIAYTNQGPSQVGEHVDNNSNCKCDYCGMFLYKEPAQVDGVYQISSIAELYWFAALVNGILDTVPQNTEADAVLTADIVVNGNVLTSDCQLVEETDTLTEWTPMGSESTPFNGTFDGQGHTISGLYINQPTADNQGLFGYVDFNGNVRRIEVTDSYIHGQDVVGGITGFNNGILTACSYSGTVIGYDYPIGGVVGENRSSVSCCYATGKVHATGFDPYVGGVVGDNYAVISSCYNIASLSTDHSGYIGGIASYNDGGGYIADSYYLQGSADKGVYDDYGMIENVESRRAEQFASGEVTWLLQHAITDDMQIWGQNLPADALPVLLSEHKVYAAWFIHESTGSQMMGRYGNLNAQIPLPTAEEVGANGEVSFTDTLGNPLTETITLLSDTVIFVDCRLYSIKVSNNIFNGEIYVPYDSCNAGAEVEVEAFTYDGYEPFMLHLTTSDGQHYEYEDFTFTMPAADVVLSADFIPYLYDEAYTISEDDNGYNIMLTWDYDASDCHTEIYRNGTLVHTTAANETSWQEQISEAGVYNYTLYVVDAQGARSRGTLLAVYAYPSTPMGISGTQSVDLGDVPELFTDDGGRNGNYSNLVDITTEITAQEDCRIYLTGNYALEQGFDYLQIYDSDNSRLRECNGMGTIEPALLSSDNMLTVRFTSDESETYEGFELYVETVYPITVAEVENGTVVADTAWARAGEIVTLTPLPNGQYAYVEGSLKVLKADDPTVEVPVNADDSFTMPAFKIIVTAAFESSTALSVPETAAWNVFGTDGMLHITGTEAEAEVYDVRGALIYRGMDRNLYLTTGVYIVRAEGQVQKAIVK